MLAEQFVGDRDVDKLFTTEVHKDMMHESLKIF